MPTPTPTPVVPWASPAATFKSLVLVLRQDKLASWPGCIPPLPFFFRSETLLKPNHQAPVNSAAAVTLKLTALAVSNARVTRERLLHSCDATRVKHSLRLFCFPSKDKPKQRGEKKCRLCGFLGGWHYVNKLEFRLKLHKTITCRLASSLVHTTWSVLSFLVIFWCRHQILGFAVVQDSDLVFEMKGRERRISSASDRKREAKCSNKEGC